MNEIDADMKHYLNHVVQSFSPGIRYACAYGSGVFKQSGHKSMKDNMIDFIFVVNNSFSWHYKNLDRFNHHYSFMKRYSPKFIASFQTDYGASVYFNTIVYFDGYMIKYGVIEEKDFLCDLTTWNHLYIAGRLQKPVLSLKGLDTPSVSEAIYQNLQSAVETSLLTLPEEFSEEELYVRIASLSYTGDFRMIVGEDKNKVLNIVKPNMAGFSQLYENVLNKNEALSFIGNGRILQDMDYTVQTEYVKTLPLTLRNNIYRSHGITSNINPDMLNSKINEFVSSRENCKKTIVNGISKIVRKSSITQTAKGVLTAGTKKTIYYSMAKLAKMFKGIIR